MNVVVRVMVNVRETSQPPSSKLLVLASSSASNPSRTILWATFGSFGATVDLNPFVVYDD